MNFEENMNNENMEEILLNEFEEMPGDDDKKIHSATVFPAEGGDDSSIDSFNLDDVAEKDVLGVSKSKKSKGDKDKEIEIAKTAKMQDPDNPDGFGDSPEKGEFHSSKAEKMQDDEGEQFSDAQQEDLEDVEDEEEGYSGGACGGIACQLKDLAKKVTPFLNSLKDKVKNLVQSVMKGSSSKKENSGS